MVPEEFIKNVKELFTAHNLTYSVTIPNVGKLIKQQFNQMKGRQNVTNLTDFDYGVYHPYEEVWLKFEFDVYVLGLLGISHSNIQI